MKQQASQALYIFPAKLQPHGALLMVSSLALVFALGACGKKEENKTAGQQVDSVIEKTEQAAAQARAKTEATLATAGTALKDAAQNAESSAKELAGKAGEKMDDAAITAAVSSGIAKDSDLSMLRIKVDTKDGAVTLNGTAPTEAAREKAGSIAKAVKGVHSVDNQVLVKAN